VFDSVLDPSAVASACSGAVKVVPVVEVQVVASDVLSSGNIDLRELAVRGTSCSLRSMFPLLRTSLATT
jgi:hypothetical protein